MPDTLKAQYTAFLTAGRVLYSDMGRVLCSIIGDSAAGTTPSRACGTPRHRGAGSARGSYQELRNDFHRNARDNFMVELGKHGLGKRDIVANVNFFVRGRVGRRRTRCRSRGPTRSRGLTSTCGPRWTRWWCCRTRPHPLDPSRDLCAAAGGVDDPAAAARRAADDPCRLSRPENARGFALTETYVREHEASAERRVTPNVQTHRGKSISSPRARRLRPGARRRGSAGRTRSSPRSDCCASSIWRETRRSTRCFTTPATSTNATAPPTPSRAGQHLSDHGTRAAARARGEPLLTIVADTCGRHDTLGRRLLRREQQVRYALDKQLHAQLPRQLPAGAGRGCGRGMTQARSVAATSTSS